MNNRLLFRPLPISGIGSLMIILLFSCSFNLLAADSAQSPADEVAQVSLVEVAPVQRAPALLAPNAQTPPPPASFDKEERLQLMAIRVGNPSAEDSEAISTSTQTVVLSAARTVQEGQAVLTLVQPYSVHPETGIHMRGSVPGSVGVKIKVEKGANYLVDFLVRSSVPGTYQLDTEGQSQQVGDPNGAREHVLLALDAKSSGWTTVRLKRPESDFFLYSVEVTKFD